MSETLAPQLDALAASLRDAGLAASVDDVRDILWLADVRGPPVAGPSARVAGPVTPDPDRQRLDVDPPAADGQVTGAQSLPARDEPALYASAQRGRIAAGMLRVPGVAVLPAPADLRRALQPLARRVPSATRWQLDEEATATHKAETGTWRLCLQPLRERWFDLNVIVEVSPSMRLWRPEVETLVRAFKGQGGFRSLRRFVLASGPALLRTADGSRALPLAALQPAGRRPLTLLVTDTGSALWRSGAAQRFLFAAGAQTLVSVLQLLPTRAWRHTALGEPEVAAIAAHPGSPNTRLLPVSDGDEIDADDAHDADRRLVPLLGLDSASIRRWAGAMAARVAATVPCAAVARNAAPAPEANPDQTPAEAVAAFRRKVSQAAYDLAVFLTVPDPLTLPVMRLVQRTMLPDTGTGELAECMLGGLLVPTGEDAGVGVAVYRFRDGVRDELMRALRYSEEDLVARQLVRVGQTLAQAQVAGAGDDFSAYFPQPGGGARLSEWALPFATVSRGILQALQPPALAPQPEAEAEAPRANSEDSEPSEVDTNASRRNLVVRVRGLDGTWTTGYRLTREHVVTAWRTESPWETDGRFEVALSIGTARHTRQARLLRVDPHAGAVVLVLETPLDPGPEPLSAGGAAQPGSALRGLVLFDTYKEGEPAPGAWFEGVVEAVQPDFIVRCPLLEQSLPHDPGLPGSPLWADGKLVGHLLAPGTVTGTWRACPIAAVLDLPQAPVQPRRVAYLSAGLADLERLQPWLDAMRDAGLQVVPEPLHSAASDNWSSRVRSGLKQAGCAVMAISHAWHASKWCQFEASTLSDRARNEPGFRIVPLRLDDAEMPAEFQHLLALDLRGSTQPSQALIHALVTGLHSASTDSTDDRRRSVLWVDDIPGNNVNERQTMESMGLAFTIARSTQEALALFGRLKFAAIISDMGRKEGPSEGYVLLQAIRALDQNIPFFIYAGSKSAQHQREAAQKGAQGSTNNPDELVEWVASALLGGTPPSSVKEDPSPPPEPWFADRDPQLVAIGSLIAEFRTGLDATTRRAVAESLLLAHLAANRSAADDSGIANWYRRYTDVLTNTGWTAKAMAFTHQELPATEGGVREAVLPVLSTMLGPKLATSSLLLPLLSGLGQWQQEPLGIQLFHRASEHLGGARFQIAFIDADASGNPEAQVLCIGIEAERTITAVLFFKTTNERAQIHHASGHFSISSAMLDGTRDAVSQRVASQFPAMVRNLEV